MLKDILLTFLEINYIVKIVKIIIVKYSLLFSFYKIEKCEGTILVV